MQHTKHAGFTLIELVIVIVILGILAAAALPRFSDLSTDARKAAVDGLAGALRSAAAIAHATQLAKGYSDGQTVTLEGTAIAMSAGYPVSSSISGALTDFTGFTAVAFTNSRAIEFRLGGRLDCMVRYEEATSTAGPSIVARKESSGGDPC